MKRFLPFFVSAVFLLLSHTTSPLFAETTFSLNLPQTVNRMERRGWTLEQLQRIPSGAEDYFVAIYRRSGDSQRIRPPLLMIYHRDTYGSVRVIETGREYILTPVRDIPRDINRDGRPEAVVEFFTGGTGWEYTWLEVYTLDGGKASRFISPKQGNLVLRNIQDIDGDSVPDLIFLDTQWEFYGRFDHASSPAVWRYMRWDPIEGRYREDPQRFWMAYEEDIQTTLSCLDEETFFYSYVGDALSILLNYHLLGETGRGWAEFNSLLSNKPPANPEDLYADEAYQQEMLNEIRTDLTKRFGESLY